MATVWVRKTKFFSDGQKKRMAKLFVEKKMSPTQIAKLAGATPGAVREILRHAGVYHSNREKPVQVEVLPAVPTNGALQKVTEKAQKMLGVVPVQVERPELLALRNELEYYRTVYPVALRPDFVRRFLKDLRG